MPQSLFLLTNKYTKNIICADKIKLSLGNAPATVHNFFVFFFLKIQALAIETNLRSLRS